MTVQDECSVGTERLQRPRCDTDAVAADSIHDETHREAAAETIARLHRPIVTPHTPAGPAMSVSALWSRYVWPIQDQHPRSDAEIVAQRAVPLCVELLLSVQTYKPDCGALNGTVRTSAAESVDIRPNCRHNPNYVR